MSDLGTDAAGWPPSAVALGLDPEPVSSEGGDAASFRRLAGGGPESPSAGSEGVDDAEDEEYSTSAMMIR